jgi:tetratricopeptide (TPR) repeat protein
VLITLLTAVILSNKYTRKIIFGSGFFLITILPVLQFIPIGKTIVADRYVYIASIGIFYILAEGVFWLFAGKVKYPRFMQHLILITLIVISSVLVLLTWKRCQVWRDSISLWNDVLNKYSNVATAYNNRGNAYIEQGNIQQAISDFNKAIEINPSYAVAYKNRGVVYYLVKEYDKAWINVHKAGRLGYVVNTEFLNALRKASGRDK